ncbi:MAG: hypothetical protein AAF493_20735 [Pseudomonadota bacterium]
MAVRSSPSLVLHMRALGWVLNLTRLNIILLGVVAVLLTVAQGQDLLRAMFEDGGLKWLSLTGSTALWCVSSWLWARVLLDIDFPNPPLATEHLKLLVPYRKHLPRLLGAAGFFVLAINLYRAGSPLWLVGVVVLEGVGFYWFLVKRRAIGRWLANRLNPTAPTEHWAWADELRPSQPRPVHESAGDALGEIRGRIALATVVLGTLLLIWGVAAPLGLGRTFDTLLLIMLWSATVLPIGSLVTYWANRFGVPILLILSALVLVFSGSNDNHSIRAHPENMPVENRTTFNASIEDWQRTNCSDTGCPRFVFVATAGGGIRAAFWTGVVLGELHDTSRAFRKQLYGVSGVSGGSVGATVYRAVRDEGGEPPIRPAIERVLGQDYLGPVSAGLLYPDALQRFMPVPFFQDRAAVFEQGMEANYRLAFPHSVGLTGSFVALTKHPSPVLFLNSTWSDNGRRIVASNVLPPSSSDAARILYQDLLHTLGHDMRLSTAAHNSARFPVVSPAGAWQPVGEPKAKDGEIIERQRLQDGGLFENFGAETALETLIGAQSRFPASRFKPFVILISSDPALDDELAKPPFNPPIAFAHEVRSTLHTFATTRTGRGAEAAARLQDWAERNGLFAHFRMCADAGRDAPPLGWALSKVAQTEIRQYLTGEGACRTGNRRALSALLDALGP